MLFSSAEFLLLFLPAVIVGFFTLFALLGRSAAVMWLIGASLYFYLAWNPAHAWVIGASLAGNYICARLLLAETRPAAQSYRLVVLWCGVILNTGFLLSFKILSGGIWGSGSFIASYSIAIPLAVSFVTFQQIAFLVDIYKGRILEIRLKEYLLYILFFPQLVMGPIVHYREIVPQFHKESFGRPNGVDISVGLAIFLVGLAKKVVLADSIAPFVNDAFQLGPEGLSFFDAWAAAIGFQFQIYFDFSGYADMAIGLARMISIRLPLNFDSPFRAVDRFDVWRRWHVSFGAFMRQYVFFPLCRSRKFRLKPSAALIATVMISALWHGIGMTFAIWGVIQAALMWSHHLRHRWAARNKWPRILAGGLPVSIRIALTFAVTAIIGVMFRSPDLDTAFRVYAGMLGAEGIIWPLRLADLLPAELAYFSRNLVLDGPTVLYMAVMAIVIWGLPTTASFFRRYWTAIDQRKNPPQRKSSGIFPAAERICFGLTAWWGLLFGLLAVLIIMYLSQPGRFIYYQF